MMIEEKYYVISECPKCKKELLILMDYDKNEVVIKCKPWTWVIDMMFEEKDELTNKEIGIVLGIVIVTTIAILIYAWMILNG